MDPELFEKTPFRKWNQLTANEQREALAELRHSHYFRHLPKKLQAMISDFI